MCSTRTRRTRTRTCRRGHNTMRKVARTPLALCTSSLCLVSQTRLPRSRPPHNQQKDSNSNHIIINSSSSNNNSISISISKRLWDQPHLSPVRNQHRHQEGSTPRPTTTSAKTRCRIRTGPPAQRPATSRGPPPALGREVPAWALVRLGRRRSRDSLRRCAWASRALARESESE